MTAALPLPDDGRDSLCEFLREDALKWRDLAKRDGGATDPKAEQMLELLDAHELYEAALKEIAELPGSSEAGILARRALDGRR